MIDIIRDAWTSASECKLLMEHTTDEDGRSLFRKLAANWEKVARHYETLAENDNYLKELRRSLDETRTQS